MQASVKKVTIVCALVSGLVVAGWYGYFQQKGPVSNRTVETQEAFSAYEQLATKIDRINADVLALRNNPGAGREAQITQEVTALQRDMETFRTELGLRSKSPDKRPDARIAEKLDALHREIGVLRDRLNALSNDGALVPDGAAAAYRLPQSVEEQEQEARTQVEQQLALYKSVARQEGIDQTWAGEAQEAIYQSLQELAEEGIGALEVNCHSSFCEAHFFFDTTDAATALQKLQDISPWGSEAFIIADTERGEGTMYLAREGSSLPEQRNEKQ